MKLSIIYTVFCLFFSALNFSYAQNTSSSAVSFDSTETFVPACKNNNSDPDGDGWGWENMRSCHLGSQFVYEKHPICSSANSDPDGDGWGWENNVSCKVDEESALDTENSVVEKSRYTIDVSTATKSSGFGYALPSKNFKSTPDTLGQPNISNLILYEDGVEIGPAHSTHNNIRNIGNGMYSDWEGSSGFRMLWFSSSDNSDPRTNGRVYSYSIVEVNNLSAPDEVKITLANFSNNIVTRPIIDNKNSVSSNNSPVFKGVVKITNNTKNYGKRHWYSTRSSFNSDSSLIVLQEGPESKTVADLQVLVDIKGNLVERLPFQRDAIWSRNDPKIIFGVRILSNGTYELIKYNISNKTSSIIFSSPSKFQIGPKSAVSYDDRYLSIQTSHGGNFIKTIDLTLAKEVASIPNPLSHPTIGSNIVSPSGKYVLTIEQDSVNGGNSIYRRDINLKNRTLMTTKADHFDVNLDENGKDFLAVVGSPPEIVEIETGKRTLLSIPGSSLYGHVSGSGKPGQFVWGGKLNGDRVLFKTDISDGKEGIMNRVVCDDLLDQNAISYRAQRKANASPDGNYIIYTTDYGDGTHLHDEFVVGGC